jgi:hypothetical protein
MPTLEETMRDALRRHTPARDAGEVFDRLADRRRRRTLMRKFGTIGLVVAVLGGTVGAFALLGHAFGTGPQPLQAPTAGNGALVVSLQTEDGFSLYVLPPEKQDLAPAASAVAAGRDAMRNLTGTGGERDVQPAVSPDGSTVAYVRHASKNEPGALWTIGIDGSRTQQIVPESVAVEDPAWSPDGTWIAFTGVITDVRALYLVHPDGSDMHVLPFTPESTVGSPAWSPDGTSIVFSASPVFGDGLSDLWAIAPDGSDLRNLTSTTGVDETDPTWSPDGAWIAYATPDGIEQIPADGGSAQVLVPASGVPSDRLPAQPAWSPDGRYLAFAFGPTEPLPPVVYILPVDGTTAFPLAQGWEFAWQPIPANGVTPSPSVEHQLDLGLGYPVCRVSSMPINTNGVPGAAYVFTRETADGCPARGDGILGVDVDNDLVVDATYGPLEDCFLRCEAFAAPDVNADGVSEVAVSTEGADGYGVYLFVISTSDTLSIDPTHVEDPQNLAHVLDPLQIAWVDVATHFEGARCGHLDDGTPTLMIEGGDKLPPDADVRTTTLVLDGSTATVVDASRMTIPLAGAPVPGNQFCGTPIYNSAANFPNAVDPSAVSRLCDRETVDGDLDGDGNVDSVTIATVSDGSSECPADGTRKLVVDLGSDGTPDLQDDPPDCSTWCTPFALADVNGDDRAELFINEGHAAAPASVVVAAYELDGTSLRPIPFEGGALPSWFRDQRPNRFLIQNSWQGYNGAFCSQDHSFVVWTGTTDPSGTLARVSYQGFRLNTQTMTFDRMVEQFPSFMNDRLPDKTGWDEFCGSAVSIG